MKAAVDSSGGGRALVVVKDEDMSDALRNAANRQRNAVLEFCLYAAEELLNNTDVAEALDSILEQHAMLECTQLNDVIKHRMHQMKISESEEKLGELAMHAGTRKSII